MSSYFQALSLGGKAVSIGPQDNGNGELRKSHPAFGPFYPVDLEPL